MEPIYLAHLTLQRSIDIPKEVHSILARGEQPVAAFATLRDSAVFTTKRLILKDSQGVTGRKSEVFSIPFSQVHMWSTENAGTFDITTEIELWTREGRVKIQIGRGVDVRAIDQLIANCVFGS